MEITYFGHSCFRLKGKQATVVTDPYGPTVGFSLPKLSADIVTVSHNHDDHNAVKGITGTARREQPYLISAPGEYEINGVGVFGWGTYHDAVQGKNRGKNTVYSIHIDGIRVAHMGDLGHELSDQEKERLGQVDVMLVPVGGYYSLDAKAAHKLINSIQPSIVVPMHYKTQKHSEAEFGQIQDLQNFLREMAVEAPNEEESLKLTELDLPEETQVMVMKPMV